MIPAQFLLPFMWFSEVPGVIGKVFNHPPRMIESEICEPISLRLEKGPILNLWKREASTSEDTMKPGERGSVLVDDDKLLVRFWALGRRFQCLAIKKASVVSGDSLEVTFQGPQGSMDYVFTEKDLNHFEGHLLGDSTSPCYGYPEEDGKLSMVIESKNEGHLFVEPSTSVLYSDVNNASSTWYNNIVYRGAKPDSDVGFNDASTWRNEIIDQERFRPERGIQRNYGENKNDNKNLTEEIMLRRLKKLNGSHFTICTFVHSSVYEEFNYSQSTLVSKLILIYTYMDRIYRLFDYDQDGLADNLGARLVNLTIMTTPSDGLIGKYIFYPNRTAPLKAQQTLFAFQKLRNKHVKDFSRVSVSHLLMAANMDLAGLAFTGPFCVPTHALGVINALISGQLRMIPNFAFLLMHETSHILSAVDVYKGTKCAPKKFQSYHPDFGFNKEVENIHKFQSLRFTECNRKPIFKRVMEVGPFDQCFVPDKPLIGECGNLIIEKGEECDSMFVNATRPSDGSVLCCAPPLTGVQKHTILLDAPCRLTRNSFRSVCDPTHSPCCKTDCQLVTFEAKKVCFQSKTSCGPKAYCDGVSPECPRPKPTPDGSPCSNGKGICRNGECVQPDSPVVQPVLPVFPPNKTDPSSLNTEKGCGLNSPATVSSEVPTWVVGKTTTKPKVPTLVPILTTSKPKAPTVVPVKTTTKPKVPPLVPVLTTAKPKVPPIVPVLTTAKPKVPPLVPVLTTAKSKVPPLVPVLTTAKPKAPPQAPVLTTTKPKVPPLVPVLTTTEPKVPTPVPVLTTTKPKAPPPDPVLTTSKPKAPPQAPVLTTTEPKVPPLVPVLTTTKPKVPTLLPVLTTTEPKVPTPVAVLTTTKLKAPPQAPVLTTTKPKVPPLVPVLTTTEPKVPTQAPVLTTTKPKVPTLLPVLTTTEPKVPTPVAVLTTTKLKAPPQAPVLTTTKPKVPPLVPVLTTTEPKVPTQAPVLTTTKPKELPQAPVSTTTKPKAPPQAPVLTTTKPKVPPLVPVLTTTEPKVPTLVPVLTTTKPKEPPQAPVLTTTKPKVPPLIPVLTTPKPKVLPIVPVLTTLSKPQLPNFVSVFPTKLSDVTIFPPIQPIKPKSEPTVMLGGSTIVSLFPNIQPGKPIITTEPPQNPEKPWTSNSIFISSTAKPKPRPMRDYGLEPFFEVYHWTTPLFAILIALIILSMGSGIYFVAKPVPS